MLDFQLKGKKALVCGVSDDQGFGFAIAKALCEAGCQVYLGTWVPTVRILEKAIKAGKMQESMTLSDSSVMQIEKIFPLDASFDNAEDVPEELKESRRYKDFTNYTIEEVAKLFETEFGNLDILVHSLANAPEVRNPLLETSRKGYLEALSASSYSFVSLLKHFGPLMNEGGSYLTLSFIAAEKVIPGYGGGMSSAKAALESDVKTLAYEAGRKWNVRVNAISAGALASRAAKAIGFIGKMKNYSQANAPLSRDLEAKDIANSACFLLSPLASGITGEILRVDNGIHAMGVAVSAPELN
ncbi:Enoyl-[acyl-carrier-protein] reductase [NADH], chloroplastic [Chlamydiales bacterium SCGC AB-751-O23]|jgi:enoyl-[acyl-carrier protein] reductase I|nr:Enoyl-[acyl-carrier-protein] reductase [NADH], chloroplastic [Chlamydiales bacterium SCGC AB-751-O23]